MALTLRLRLLLAFLVPTLGLLGLAGFFGYQSSRAILEDELGRSLSSQAAAVAAALSAERLMALTAEDAVGEGSRSYKSLHRQLTEAQLATGARRIVTFDVNGVVRIDIGGGLPLGAEMPELLRERAELQAVRAGHRASSQVLFEGTDGRYYKTGYAPLHVDGAVVGAVAVEGSAEFYGPLQALFRAFAGLLLLTAVVLGAAAVLTARAFSRPLEQLVQSATRIGEGDLSTAVMPQPTREIGALASKLEAMRQALESRDRQLKMMLGGIAHEVKNPLGGIELFAGLLGEELRAQAPNVAEAQGHVGKVQREVQTLKRLVDDFLAFAREQKVHLAPVELSAFIRGVVELVQPDAEAKGVSVAVELTAATLTADASLLTLALVNLLKNAVQASARGATVTVRGERRGGEVVLEVEDHGPGISAELQERIFEPFFTTKEKGTGLGLPLAAKLVEAHGGTLSVSSNPGKTLFVIRLPAAVG